MKKKGIFALLITYVVISALDRLAFLFGLLVGGGIGALVTAWALR